MTQKKPKKVFHLIWICEPLMEDSSYFTKPMFGGLSIYYQDQMKLVLMESPGERTYRDQKYEHDIWNGILICTRYEEQESLKKDFPGLIPHPVLKKWLYLPMSSKNFEPVSLQITESIRAGDPRIGINPSTKKRNRKTTRSKK